MIVVSGAVEVSSVCLYIFFNIFFEDEKNENKGGKAE